MICIPSTGKIFFCGIFNTFSQKVKLSTYSKITIVKWKLIYGVCKIRFDSNFLFKAEL